MPNDSENCKFCENWHWKMPVGNSVAHASDSVRRRTAKGKKENIVCFLKKMFFLSHKERDQLLLLFCLFLLGHLRAAAASEVGQDGSQSRQRNLLANSRNTIRERERERRGRKLENLKCQLLEGRRGANRKRYVEVASVRVEARGADRRMCETNQFFFFFFVTLLHAPPGDDESAREIWDEEMSTTPEPSRVVHGASRRVRWSIPWSGRREGTWIASPTTAAAAAAAAAASATTGWTGARPTRGSPGSPSICRWVKVEHHKPLSVSRRSTIQHLKSTDFFCA